MEGNTGGKRLAAGPNKGKKTALVVLAAVAVVLAAGYVGLCAAVNGGRLWPHTTVMGVDVSGLTPAQAEQTLAEAIPQQWAGRTVELYEPGSNIRLTLEAGGLMEPADLAGDLAQARQGSGFLLQGGQYLGRLISGKEFQVPLTLQYTAQGQSRVEDVLDELYTKLGIEGNATTYEISDTHVVFRKGVTGTRVDQDAVRSGVTAALTGEGPMEVTVSLIQAPPAEPDLEAIQRRVYAQVSDAYLDRESKEIVPSVTGMDLDVEAARTALAQTGDGKTCRVPLLITEPEMSTERLTETLFRDILGDAATRVTGTADRKMNVGVAAAFINGTILFPGEEFSFNQTCSPYTVANGYGKATAYVNGLSKDTVAGGICQASSTLYWTSLMANMETLERYAHRYEPSYIKGGLDATVYGDYGDEGSLDFRFKNTSEHPIRIDASMDSKNYLHVTIYGTDETGIHGKPYSANRVVTQAFQTIYEADASVPQGTTQKDPERTGYNAVSIETYQQLVDGEDKVISTTLLYTTKYKVRNEVVLFNPADLELWGIDPFTGLRTEPVHTPADTPAPAESAEPGTEDPNGAVMPPEESVESPAPVESQGQSVETPQPQVTAPAASAEPDNSMPVLPPGTIVVGQ